MKYAVFASLLISGCALAAPAMKCDALAAMAFGKDVTIDSANLVAATAKLPGAIRRTSMATSSERRCCF